MGTCPHCGEPHSANLAACPRTGRSLAPAGALRPGELIDGKYRIVREIGGGAMGVIYVAQHVTLGRHVAVKTLRSEFGMDPELTARFEQEARAASGIGHPHIIDVFDLGRTAGGAFYMVMELLDGRSLAQILGEETRLGPARAVDLARQVLGALAAAHKHGIVHRDLKPENIFVVETEDRPSFVKLLDFGISKVLGHALATAAPSGYRGTVVGTVMGTPQYMSPEQARGQVERIDHRTDIYAAGVVLYEMLTGHVPFDGDNYNAVLAAILDGRCAPLRELCTEVSPALERVVTRAMAADRDARWESAAAMRDALARAAAGSADEAGAFEETATTRRERPSLEPGTPAASASPRPRPGPGDKPVALARIVPKAVARPAQGGITEIGPGQPRPGGAARSSPAGRSGAPAPAAPEPAPRPPAPLSLATAPLGLPDEPFRGGSGPAGRAATPWIDVSPPSPDMRIDPHADLAPPEEAPPDVADEPLAHALRPGARLEAATLDSVDTHGASIRPGAPAPGAGEVGPAPLDPGETPLGLLAPPDAAPSRAIGRTPVGTPPARGSAALEPAALVAGRAVVPVGGPGRPGEPGEAAGVELALDPRRTTRRPVRPTPSAREAAGHDAGWTRAGLKWFAIALVVAIAGGLAFRYLRHGFVLGPNEGGGVKLTLAPSHAEAWLDGGKLTERQLSLPTGSRHTLLVSAAGCLSRQITFEVRTGLELDVWLNRTLRDVSPRDPPPDAAELQAMAPVEGAGAAPEEIETAFAKVRPLEECLALASEEIHRRREHFQIVQRRGGMRQSSDIVPLPADLADRCSRLEQATRELPPRLPRLEAVGERYIRAVAGVSVLLASASEYLKSRGYLEDGNARGRDLAARLVDALDEFAAADAALRLETRAYRARWEREELARLGLRSSGGAAWHMRRFTLAAQAWVRARQAAPGIGADPRARLAALEEAAIALFEHSRRSTQDYARGGASEFLAAAESFRQIAGATADDRESARALEGFKALVGAFNALVLD